MHGLNACRECLNIRRGAKSGRLKVTRYLVAPGNHTPICTDHDGHFAPSSNTDAIYDCSWNRDLVMRVTSPGVYGTIVAQNECMIFTSGDLLTLAPIVPNVLGTTAGFGCPTQSGSTEYPLLYPHAITVPSAFNATTWRSPASMSTTSLSPSGTLVCPSVLSPQHTTDPSPYVIPSTVSCFLTTHANRPPAATALTLLHAALGASSS